MSNSPLSASIHVLDDDSLLNVFYFYRPFLLGEDDDDYGRLIGGEDGWARGRWWYTLAHVCQRWRNIVLGSPTYLGVFLVCTNGTPVVDMLEHSPPFPLVIDYLEEYGDTTAEDEEGAILALKQHDRVHRVRLLIPVTTQQKLIAAMDGEYPILEHLIIIQVIEDNSAIFTFPEALQAPHLRHLTLIGFALPMGSRLLTTAVGLVTLFLSMVDPSTYFHPNTLLRFLSFMPQLETLRINFEFAVPSRDIERHPTQMPVMTPVILPNLHIFRFRGIRTYLEALVHRVNAPRVEKLHIALLNQLTFSVPRLLQFMNATENLRFKSAKFEFSVGVVYIEAYPHEDPDSEAEKYALFMAVNCWHLDWQVFSAAQISSSLGPMLSAVEHLTLGHEVHSRSSEEHNDADRIEWRKLLGSFRNVKTLRIAKGLVEEISRCLKLDDGELPLELLPELQELTYFGSGNTGDTFTSFTDARQDAGRPLTLVRRSPSPSITPGDESRTDLGT